MNTKKLTYSAMFVALGVICSPINIPIGFAKCFPTQHFINMLCAVLLGPVYGVCCAFITSLIRNLMGTGSLLAFPGSMIGVMIAGILYQKFNKISFAFIGEIFGTGILGALLSYPIATLFMNKQVVIFTYIVPFTVSTVGGSILALVTLKALEKTKVLEKIKMV